MDQSDVEKLLRDVHVLIGDGAPVAGEPDKVIIEKQELFNKFEEISSCIYELMDQYQVTQVSRDKAKAKQRKECEQIIEHATTKANDVYSASIMYTDEAISRLTRVMDEMKTGMAEAVRQAEYAVDEQIIQVRSNKKELQDQLYEMRDANMYLNLVADRRREIEAREQNNKDSNGVVAYGNLKKPSNIDKVPYVKTEIKLNSDYFDKAKQTIEGFMLEPEESKSVGEPEIRVNMESPYFKWKKAHEQEQNQDADERPVDKAPENEE